jgi:4-hydroxybenzoate polyprenyltransferase
VILACAWLLGVIQAPTVNPLHAGLALVAVAMAFMVQEPIRQLLVIRRTGRNRERRRGLIEWTAAMALVGLDAAAPLALSQPQILWLLIPVGIIGGVYAVMLTRRASMDTLATVGFVALSLAAPAASIASSGRFDPVAMLGLWLLAAMFFCGSSYSVRIRIKGAWSITQAVGYHLCALACVAALTLTTLLPPIALLAILPGGAKLLWILRDVDRYRRLPLKRIGLQESAFSLLFVIIYSFQ